jgi:hypothetical protein
MKVIVRNVLLACIISTFCFFGALGRKPVVYNSTHTAIIKQTPAEAAEEQKETLTLLAVAGIAWALCFWRCSVINRRLNAERIYQQRFHQYMRNNFSGTRR